MALAGLMLGQPALAADPVMKIGLILSLSGPGADITQNMQRGAELYLKLHRQDLPGIDL